VAGFLRDALADRIAPGDIGLFVRPRSRPPAVTRAAPGSEFLKDL
jgi:hypothetical protein